MSDFIDTTVKREQQILNTAIANRQRYVGESATHCESCDEPIPQGCRDAVPGVKQCVWCAGRMGR